MPTRTARTAWDGGFADGTGQVELTTSQRGTFEVSFPTRSSDDGGGATNPEELLGASHSACYAMQFAALLGERGATVQSLEVTADVSLGEDTANGGFMITGIALTVRGEVDDIDAPGFAETAEEAKRVCPISKALAGVDMTLDATLETA